MQLNLVESLCMPPLSRNSILSKAAMQLLQSGQDTDMVFEVVSSPGNIKKIIVLDLVDLHYYTLYFSPYFCKLVLIDYFWVNVCHCIYKNNDSLFPLSCHASFPEYVARVGYNKLSCILWLPKQTVLWVIFRIMAMQIPFSVHSLLG